MTVSGYNFFFSTNIYSSKECHISFERAQNILSRKKTWSSWKLTTFQKKIFKSQEISKVSHKILAYTFKYCRNTLLRKFQVNSQHFPCSMTKSVLKTKSEINYDFFFDQKTGSHFRYHGNRRSESQVTRPYLNLHNLHKTSFTESYWVLHSQKRLKTHYSWNRRDSKLRNGDPKCI